MKSTLVAFALAASAFTGVAHAAMTQAPAQPTAATHAYAGKTRAEVKQELVQAQRDGQIAALRSLYQGS
jgi:hypothetical protein